MVKKKETESEEVPDKALNFNSHFLNQIVYHSIQSTEFIQKVRGIFPLGCFKTQERKFIMEMIYDHFDQYKTAPMDNFYDIFKDNESVMDSSLYEKCIILIDFLKDITGSNPEYILSKIEQAVMHLQLEEASIEFASLIKRKKYEDAKSVILKAMRPPEGVTPDYFDYFQDKEYIKDRIMGESYKMKTMIKGLDAIIGGVNPPWLVTLLGSTKSGKSWHLIEFAVAALIQGLNVTYFSLEMNKKQMVARFDQVVGFLSSKSSKEQQEVMVNIGDKWGMSKQKVKSIYDLKEVERNKKAVRRASQGGLKIIASNKGRFNYRDIERVLNQLEQEEGYITDVLVVDYLGIMKKTEEGQNKKQTISENCLGLVEICGTRNMICFTAMQGNRQAMRAKVFQSWMIADDIDTVFWSDLILAICQTKNEEKQNKARLHVANFRHGKQFGSVGLIRDLTIGQIALGEYELKEEGEEEENQNVEGADGW